MIRLPTELSEVLQQGGTVIVPSRQRAHAARLAHAAAELRRGQRVWATPDILSVEAWLTREVERYAATGGANVPRLLSPAEEWFLWRQCASDATGELELVNRGALAEALRRASALAAEFGIDIRGSAKRRRSARSDDSAGGRSERERAGSTEALGLPEALGLSEGSDGSSSLATLADEPGTEAALLADVQFAVDERCRTLGAATVASLVPQLTPPPARAGATARGAADLAGAQLTDSAGAQPAAVVASGFLTLPPRLRALATPAHDAPATEAVAPTVVIASDELDELERIAEWCKSQVQRNPDVRILVALPGSPGNRERLATLIRQAINPARWLLGATPADAVSEESADSLVVIEGGAPLAQMPAVAHALSTLSWLSGNPGDFEAVSNWLRAPYWKSPSAVSRARLDIWLRERERMQFNLRDLTAAFAGVPSALAAAAKDITSQVNKATVSLGQGAASPRDWSERFRAALEAFGWPGERARDSGEQQTVVRFYELLDEFGQLASAARSISRSNAIQWFGELATRTAFRPADDDAVVTISSVLAAPVVRYDAIWVAGLHAEAFPQPVQPDPFIPLVAQLKAGVPAASANGRLAEARALITQWRTSADALVLSAPSRAEDLELLPSPLLAEWTHSAEQPIADGPAIAGGPPAASRSLWLPTRIRRDGLLETVDDGAGVPWSVEKPLPSGTRSLELQNQCPFRAYAELRLGSTPLDAPEPGIAADLRGQLLHAALQKLWSRLRDSQGLAALSNSALEAAIHRSVEEAASEAQQKSASPRTRPSPATDAQGDLFGNPQYSPALTRECRRAERLIWTLCLLERERASFRVESTELETTLTVSGGARLNMRIDRVDALESGGRAILDYKSGRRGTADWYGERPSHPQLLAYLAALGDDVTGMATVNVTAREVRFDGIANVGELLPKVRGVEADFGTDPGDAWPKWRDQWRSRIEELAAAFVAGRAAVDPKPGACDYCHVASVCRISDRVAPAEGDEPALGAGDE